MDQLVAILTDAFIKALPFLMTAIVMLAVVAINSRATVAKAKAEKVDAEAIRDKADALSQQLILDQFKIASESNLKFAEERGSLTQQIVGLQAQVTELSNNQKSNIHDLGYAKARLEDLEKRQIALTVDFNKLKAERDLLAGTLAEREHELELIRLHEKELMDEIQTLKNLLQAKDGAIEKLKAELGITDAKV